MSELGERFHSRPGYGERTHYGEYTDTNEFFEVWEELISSGREPVEALTFLVDRLDVDEYAAAVHALSLEFGVPSDFILQRDRFFGTGMQGHIELLPDGDIFAAHMGGRRSLHRDIAAFPEIYEEMIAGNGFEIDLNGFYSSDYPYLSTRIEVLDAHTPSRRQILEHSLLEIARQLVPDSGESGFGGLGSNNLTNNWVRTGGDMGVIREGFSYVAERLPQEHRLLFAIVMDDLFADLTGEENEEGVLVYYPFFDRSTLGQVWEQTKTADQRAGIYQVIGTWSEMVSRIKGEFDDELGEYQRVLDENPRLCKRLLGLFGMYEHEP